MKRQKAYLNEYYEMLLRLNFDGEEEGVEIATKKDLAQLKAYKEKAIKQSGLTDAELTFICIEPLYK